MFNLSMVLLNIQLFSWSNDLLASPETLPLPSSYDRVDKYISYASPEDYSFHVTVRVTNDDKGDFHCSGAIIGIKWVIAGMECSPGTLFSHLPAEKIQVIPPSVSTQSDKHFHSVISVRQFTSANSSTITLIELNGEFNLTGEMRPINLPKVGEESAILNNVASMLSLLTISSVAGEYKSNQTSVKIISTFRRTPRDCYRAAKDHLDAPRKSVTCTFNPLIKIIPCSGVAGAPLFAPSLLNSNEMTLVGLTRDLTCNPSSKVPDYLFHHRISNSMIWLLKTMKLLDDEKYRDWKILSERAQETNAFCSHNFIGNWDINPVHLVDDFW